MKAKTLVLCLALLSLSIPVFVFGEEVEGVVEDVCWHAGGILVTFRPTPPFFTDFTETLPCYTSGAEIKRKEKMISLEQRWFGGPSRIVFDDLLTYHAGRCEAHIEHLLVKRQDDGVTLVEIHVSQRRTVSVCGNKKGEAP